jgi:hypothetical protein
MIAHKKAKELVNVYLDLTKRSLDIEGWIYDVNIAKQCALIAVDELLNNFLSNRTTKYGRERYHFWQVVKQEIEKL